MKIGFVENEPAAGSPELVHPPSMKTTFIAVLSLSIVIGAIGFPMGCSKKEAADLTKVTVPAKHEHHAPHGGTPVVLGDEAYHLELVRDPAKGKLQAFVLDARWRILCDAPPHRLKSPRRLTDRRVR